MINFCHISPTPFLQEFTATNGAHLILAHLVEADPVYREYYANLDDGYRKIMDNSAFEMYKQGRPMYPTEKLLDMAQACCADTIVLSDFPGEPAERTIEAAKASIDVYHNSGFQTFFVPQSRPRDVEDYLRCFQWGLESDVDLIGVSILGAPLAFGVERGNKLQRFLARWHLMNMLRDRGLLENGDALKRLHFLGMVDGPNEIELVREYHPFIFSWDSSAAVWAGLNGIRFDGSPTGLIDGKYEVEVDFQRSECTDEQRSAVFANIEIINRMVGRNSD